MKVFLSTREGYSKDLTPQSKKRYADKGLTLQFSGNDAPVKAVRALMQKYGITVEDL